MSIVNTSSSASHQNTEQTQIKVKEPKRILHFSDGTLEEYSSDEETDQGNNCQPVQEIPSEWIPWAWHTTANVGHKTLQVCDAIGEYLANFFGITSSKYYAEIEYYKESLRQKQMTESSHCAQNVEMKCNDSNKLAVKV